LMTGYYWWISRK